MKGFNKKYKNFPDYILKITKQIWEGKDVESIGEFYTCLLYTSPSPRDATLSRMPSSA